MSATPLRPCSACGGPASPDLQLIDGSAVCSGCADNWTSSSFARTVFALEQALQETWLAFRRLELLANVPRLNPPPVSPAATGKPSLAVVPSEPTDV